MAENVYISNVQIVRQRGPYRIATLPGEDRPVEFSVHGGIARHYGVDENAVPKHAATIDYIVAATGG